MFVDLDHPRVGSFTLTRSPIRLGEEPIPARPAVPSVGEYTCEVLEEVGYDIDRVPQLHEKRPRGGGSNSSGWPRPASYRGWPGHPGGYHPLDVVQLFVRRDNRSRSMG
jgi:hypothetical protein